MNTTGMTALAALAICTLTACAPTTPNLDNNFGEASRVLRAQQTRNPDAPVANRDKLPDGLEGRAAREAYERYQQSFTNPPQPTVNVFGVGLGGTSGGGN